MTSLNVSSIRRRCGLRRRINLRRRHRHRHQRRLGPARRRGIVRRIVCRGISTCRRCKMRRRMRRVGARASRVLSHFPCFFVFHGAIWRVTLFIDEYSNHATNPSPLLVLYHTCRMRSRIIYTVLTYFKNKWFALCYGLILTHGAMWPRSI